MNLMMLAESGAGSLRGDDGMFSFEELSGVHFDNRAAMAELLRDDLVERCEATPTVDVDGASVDLTEACAALADWDGRLDVDSAGAPLFREFLAAFAALDAGSPFQVAFDADEPVATPNTLAEAPNSGADPVLVALAGAAQTLGDAGFALTATLGELQYTLRGADRIPIHGGTNAEGAFNIVDYASGDGTLLPGLPRGTALSGSGLTDEGYPINRGSSSIMVVHFAEDGPEARALLTYSQSNDPVSDHYGDQTVRFSDENWRPVLFREADIDADPNLVEEEIVGTSTD
jgi:acyl-homoserine-lactone acylase